VNATAARPPLCRRGHRHRDWTTYARCALAPLLWIGGAGRWASISDCRGQSYRTVELHATAAEAEQARAGIDRYGCGGRCSKAHRVLELGRDA
jgi:hypothetical protein